MFLDSIHLSTIPIELQSETSSRIDGFHNCIAYNYEPDETTISSRERRLTDRNSMHSLFRSSTFNLEIQ